MKRLYNMGLLNANLLEGADSIRRQDPERTIYLAVPLTTYKIFFQLDFPKEMVEENQIRMIIYDVQQEAIAEWRN